MEYGQGQSELNNLPTIVLQKDAPRILEITLANFQDDWTLGSVFALGGLNIPYVQYFKVKSLINSFRFYAKEGFTIKGKIWGVRDMIQGKTSVTRLGLLESIKKYRNHNAGSEFLTPEVQDYAFIRLEGSLSSSSAQRGLFTHRR